MGISLSNHEDRIKKLEEIKTVGFKIEKIYDKWRLLDSTYVTIATLSELPDFLWLEASFGGDNNIWADSRCIPFNMIVDRPIVVINSYNLENTPSLLMAKYISSSKALQLAIMNSRSYDDGIRTVWTLKLYYSFSYNIIYKILRSKISRLVSVLHFNLFEILSRRGGVKYGN